MFGLGTLGSLGVVSGNSGPSYDPAAASYFARIPAQTSARYALLNTVFVGLRATGLLSLLDALGIEAAADTTTARTNLISSSYTLTPVAAPVFVADRGYTGDGSSSYLKTGFVPSTAVGAKFSLNSASLFAWSRTNLAANANTLIGTSGSGPVAYLNPANNAGTTISAGINCGNTNPVATIGSTIGLFSESRVSSASYDLYKNASALGNVAIVSTSLPPTEVTLLAAAGGASFGTRQIAAHGWGAGLTAQNISDLFSILNSYLTAIGAA